jgi:hypothetical protein
MSASTAGIEKESRANYTKSNGSTCAAWLIATTTGRGHMPCFAAAVDKPQGGAWGADGYIGVCGKHVSHAVKCLKHVPHAVHGSASKLA